MIFTLALPSNQQLIPGTPKPGLTNPLPLCAVCSSWRSLALTTPQLWKRVFVHIPFNISRAEAELKVVDLVPWIERSGPLPLTLFISYDDNMPLDETRPVASIAQVLNHYAPRWEALYLQYPDQNMHRIGSDSSPLFRIIEWSSLKQVYWFRTHTNPLAQEHKIIPWAQLTHLEINCSISFSHAVSIFKGCQKLLRLSISIESWSFEALASPVTLHDLSVMHLTTANLSAVVQLISLPSIREISVQRMARRPADLKSLLCFLARSSCTLDKLKIYGPPFAPGELVHILAHRSCNSLISLIISDYRPSTQASADDNVLQRLALHQNDSLCTHLKYLVLDCQGPLSTLLNMVESRIGSNVCQLPDGLLQYLRLRILNFHDEEELDEVIKRSGMEYVVVPEKSINIYTVTLRRRGLRLLVLVKLDDSRFRSDARRPQNIIN